MSICWLPFHGCLKLLLSMCEACFLSNHGQPNFRPSICVKSMCNYASWIFILKSIYDHLGYSCETRMNSSCFDNLIMVFVVFCEVPLKNIFDPHMKIGWCVLIDGHVIHQFGLQFICMIIFYGWCEIVCLQWYHII